MAIASDANMAVSATGIFSSANETMASNTIIIANVLCSINYPPDSLIFLQEARILLCFSPVDFPSPFRIFLRILLPDCKSVTPFTCSIEQAAYQLFIILCSKRIPASVHC